MTIYAEDDDQVRGSTEGNEGDDFAAEMLESKLEGSGIKWTGGSCSSKLRESEILHFYWWNSLWLN